MAEEKCELLRKMNVIQANMKKAMDYIQYFEDDKIKKVELFMDIYKSDTLYFKRMNLNKYDGLEELILQTVTEYFKSKITEFGSEFEKIFEEFKK